MDKSKKDCKSKNIPTPIERHDTAAWANIEKEKPISDITVPSDFNMHNAKDYVDVNEK